MFNQTRNSHALACVPRILFLLSRLPFLHLAFPRPSLAVIDVWVDPGHGARGVKGPYDNGTLGIDGPGSPNEADLAWGIAQHLQADLESFGFTTALSRNANG